MFCSQCGKEFSDLAIERGEYKIPEFKCDACVEFFCSHKCLEKHIKEVALGLRELSDAMEYLNKIRGRIN
jgi:hypothetical protein